jgi:hypothetical protein
MTDVQSAVDPTSPTMTNRKASTGEAKEKEKRYKCQFCNRAFSRSEHRSRHERSRKCNKYFLRVPLHPAVARLNTRGRVKLFDGQVGWRGTWRALRTLRTLRELTIDFASQIPKSDLSNA